MPSEGYDEPEAPRPNEEESPVPSPDESPDTSSFDNQRPLSVIEEVSERTSGGTSGGPSVDTSGESQQEPPKLIEKAVAGTSVEPPRESPDELSDDTYHSAPLSIDSGDTVYLDMDCLRSRTKSSEVPYTENTNTSSAGDDNTSGSISQITSDEMSSASDTLEPGRYVPLLASRDAESLSASNFESIEEMPLLGAESTTDSPRAVRKTKPRTPTPKKSKCFSEEDLPTAEEFDTMCQKLETGWLPKLDWVNPGRVEPPEAPKTAEAPNKQQPAPSTDSFDFMDENPTTEMRRKVSAPKGPVKKKTANFDNVIASVTKQSRPMNKDPGPGSGPPQ